MLCWQVRGKKLYFRVLVLQWCCMAMEATSVPYRPHIEVGWRWRRSVAVAVVLWLSESVWVSEWVSEWVSVWVGEWVSEWVSEKWVSEKWVSGWVNECAPARVSAAHERERARAKRGQAQGQARGRAVLLLVTYTTQYTDSHSHRRDSHRQCQTVKMPAVFWNGRNVNDNNNYTYKTYFSAIFHIPRK